MSVLKFSVTPDKVWSDGMRRWYYAWQEGEFRITNFKGSPFYSSVRCSKYDKIDKVERVFWTPIGDNATMKAAIRRCNEVRRLQVSAALDKKRGDK